jgi:HPt (histidine-containing phosphotransfer) domain-containing protein
MEANGGHCRCDATVPAPVETVIDLDHLARMTLGEASLEAEVLTLFDRQAAVLLAHMRDAPPAAVAAFAHTLKGSARGIGAWRVAEAAAVVEMNAVHPDADGAAQAAARLAAAVNEVRAAIAERLELQASKT